MQSSIETPIRRA